MSSRRLIYIAGVLMLAFVFSSPMILTVVQVIIEVAQGRGLKQIFPPIPFVGKTAYHSNHMTNSAAFWNDEFIYCTGSFSALGDGEPQIVSVNPDSGEMTNIKLKLKKNWYFSPTVFGDRIWWVGAEAFEVVDGVTQPSDFVWAPGGQRDGKEFLLDGKPAIVDKLNKSKSWTVSTFSNGVWQVKGEVGLPNLDHTDTSETPQELVSGIECHNRGDRLHLFLGLKDGQLFHREGLDLKPWPEDANDPVAELTTTSDASHFDETSRSWSRIEIPTITPQSVSSQGKSGRKTFWGMFIADQPAVLIFDEIQSRNPVGHVFRFDGQSWTEFATQQFPLGSHAFRVFTTKDGQRSYITASTSLGAANVYALDATGIRSTNGGRNSPAMVFSNLIPLGALPVLMLIFGIVFGLGTWILMWWFTKPEYEFGVQSVRLASLGWRGFARLIDLSLITLTTLTIGWLMMRGIDWPTLAEALNLHTDHPTVKIAIRAATVSAIWLVVIVLAMFVTQGAWGVTPGKWLCRLRTVRTSLRPCGFANSLAREIVFFVDCCNFLCWTPGILSIAFTERRQRLGDLVADTIVVEKRS